MHRIFSNAIICICLQKLMVKDLKEKVKSKLGVPPEEQKLVFEGKEMRDGMILSDFPNLGNEASVHLVYRLHGGATGKEFVDVECCIPSGVSMTHESCLICLESPSMLMPCGHPMHSHCLMNYAWIEVSASTKSQILCPLCTSEWCTSILIRYGCAPVGEIHLLGEGLSRNAIISDPDISECQGCNCFCERIDKKETRVFCRVCHKQGKNGWYCWYCKKPWASSANADKCGNPTCNSASIISQIQNSPLIDIGGVICPSVRLCPSCGTAIEHNEGCKQMTCRRCEVEFCFICLR